MTGSFFDKGLSPCVISWANRHALVLPTVVPVVAWAQRAEDSREQTEKVRDILDALQAEPGKRIADVGAGEGFYTFRLAKAVGSTGRVTAVDVSEKYLEKLGERLKQDNITNVDVVVGAVDDRAYPQTAAMRC